MRTRRALRDFLPAESGSATIESVLWLPIFLAFFGLVVDASMMFSNRSLVLRVIQDANRGYAMDRLTTAAEAQSYVYERIKGITPSATVTTSVSSGTVSTRVVAPAHELDAVGLFGLLSGFNVAVGAQHLMEN